MFSLYPDCCVKKPKQRQICDDSTGGGQLPGHFFSKEPRTGRFVGEHVSQYRLALTWVCSAMMLLLLLHGCIHASQILPPNASTGMPCRKVHRQCAGAFLNDILRHLPG